jgi:putative acetyltransferase
MENLTRELAERYGDEGGGHYRPEDAEREGAAFVIAYQGDAPVGCGAARPLDTVRGVAELKRMYVVPGARGHGVGAAVLHALEGLALELGFRELWLEAGTLQPEAIRLYERAGFTPIPSYGYHASDPRCRCFGKRLTGR